MTTTVAYTATATAVAWIPSPDRTTVVPSMSAALARGVSSVVLNLPPKQQPEDLDFSFDISANIPPYDTIASVACAPSQPVGLTVLGCFYNGTLATVWFDGGTAGQTYLLDITIETVQGRTRYLQATILVPGLPQLPASITVVTVPQSYVDNAVAAVAAIANAAAIQANAAAASAAGAVQKIGATMTGPLRPTIADGLTGTGTNQATALLLTAQNVVIASATASGGFRLPASGDVGGILAPITVRNKDLVNDAVIYPPVGGQIDAIGVNNPAAVGTGGQITFLPGTTNGQWWA